MNYGIKSFLYTQRCNTHHKRQVFRKTEDWNAVHEICM
jgi:hypothetical protein